MFDELMINSEQITAKTETTIAMDIRLPWYRSLPISCIERLEFTIDGIRISAENTRLISDGIQYPAAGLAALCDTQWFVLDTKQALLSLDAPLSPGAHEVSLLMGLRIPYRDTNYGVDNVDEKYTQYAICSKTLPYRGRELR